MFAKMNHSKSPETQNKKLSDFSTTMISAPRNVATSEHCNLEPVISPRKFWDYDFIHLLIPN